MYVYPGDLVFSRLSEPYGRSCILPDTYPRYVIAVDNVVLRTNEDKRFICYISQSHPFQEIAKEAATGTTLKRISRTKLGNIQIPLPPLNEQHEIVNFLDQRCSKIDNCISDIRQEIELLQQYKKSTIWEYVTGKRRVPIS